MDFYLNKINCIKRLISEWEKYNGLIIALDFDNTIYDFHHEGHLYNDIISLVKKCKEFGCKIVIFAAREESDYPFITEYCESIGLDIDGINENLPYLPFNTRKIYYNILLDDRAGLLSAYQTLKFVLNYIKKNNS